MPSKMLNNNSHTVSVIVPVYNEATNILPLIERIQTALADFAYQWELVMVDDGSRDQTVARLHEAAKQYGSHINIVELQRNFGQTAAMQAGIDAARGEFLVTLDGDLQNDPMDIPAMVYGLQERNLDLLVGWRQNRQDKLVLRKIPSKIANKLIAKVTGIYLHDYGCSLKVYRANIVKKIRLYGEMHRFIPAWIATVTSVSRIGEQVVTHHKRLSGESKYGISRTFRVIIDLLFIWFFMRYRARPGHFFGGIGLVLGFLGLVILGGLGIDKLVFGANIGGRPLFMTGILLTLASLQFLTTGVLAELLTRIYYESSDKCAYVIRQTQTSLTERTWSN
jgi:glycosyltransferase involved in cell wall biosynthesis